MRKTTLEGEETVQASGEPRAGFEGSPVAALVHCPAILLTDERGTVVSASTGGGDICPE